MHADSVGLPIDEVAYREELRFSAAVLSEQHAIERGMPFVASPQSGAVFRGHLQRTGEKVNHAQARPRGSLLADEIVSDPDGCPFFMPAYVVGEELAVVAFQAAPQPGARGQMFSELHQHRGQLAQGLVRPDRGMIGKAALALRQHSPQLATSETYHALVKRGGKQFRRSLKTKDRHLASRRLADLRQQVSTLALSESWPTAAVGWQQ